MELLKRADILARLQSRTPDSALYIDPLLDDAQIGNVTIDLRLGYDFLVSVLTRSPSISVSKSDPAFRAIGSYFRNTRREIGDRFILYPQQVALTTTLEYIGLPADVYADVLTRSSYTRLGIQMNTMIQPGFRGCFPVELFNQGNNPVELVVGSRIFQARLFSIGATAEYLSGHRKYFGDVRPTLSRAPEDEDLERLKVARERR